MNERLITADDFPLWTVYDHPSDYPDCFVARLWDLYGNRSERVLTAATIKQLRAAIQDTCDFVLSRIDRQAEDDPVIIESWL